MLAQCPRFEGEASDFTDSGTARHKALARSLKDNDPLPMQDIPEDEREGVEWAVEYIRLHAPMGDYQVAIEQRGSFIGPDFAEITGTPDIVCGPHIFDLKWRQRDYHSQMAAYALMNEHDPVTVHVLFADVKRAQVYRFSKESAEAIVMPIIERAQSSQRPTACDYCGWCRNKLTCPAIVSKAVEVASGYSEDPRAKTWHPSEMQSADDLAMALWIWRKILKPWGKSLEFHALEAAEKRGLSLKGFELSTKSGKTYCSDVAQAFGLAGLPQDKFLQCCDLRLNTSKKYPDKKGVIDVYAEQIGIKKAPAKRELLRKLEPVLKQTKPSLSLRSVGDDDDDNEE